MAGQRTAVQVELCQGVVPRSIVIQGEHHVVPLSGIYGGQAAAAQHLVGEGSIPEHPAHIGIGWISGDDLKSAARAEGPDVGEQYVLVPSAGTVLHLEPGRHREASGVGDRCVVGAYDLFVGSGEVIRGCVLSEAVGGGQGALHRAVVGVAAAVVGVSVKGVPGYQATIGHKGRNLGVEG